MLFRSGPLGDYAALGTPWSADAIGHPQASLEAAAGAVKKGFPSFGVSAMTTGDATDGLRIGEGPGVEMDLILLRKDAGGL